MAGDDWKSEIALLRHHAYCIEGDCRNVFEDVKVLLGRQLKIATNTHPDFFLVERDMFSIDDAHDISRRQSTKPFSGFKNFFILSFKTITREAQNALLKTLEDPAGESVFILVVPSVEILLPTVRSRVMKLEYRTRSLDREHPAEAEDFLRSTLRERMEYIKKISEAISSENKSKYDALDFVREIEKIYKNKLQISDRQSVKVLETIINTEKNLELSGASVKMLLEHLALVLPRISS